jgi:hypothetical protein
VSNITKNGKNLKFVLECFEESQLREEARSYLRHENELAVYLKNFMNEGVQLGKLMGVAGE